MNTIILFIIALGLAMDCFTISISNSSVSGLVKPGIPLKTAIMFTLAHILLVWLGYRLGLAMANLVAGMELWIAFFVFASIGGKMIFDAYRRNPEAKVFDINSMRVILGLSLATSMDSFLVGIVIALLLWPLGLTMGLIAITVFVFTLSGLAGGINLGLPFARKTAYFGGAFMLIAAIWFLVSITRMA